MAQPNCKNLFFCDDIFHISYLGFYPTMIATRKFNIFHNSEEHTEIFVKIIKI